MIAHRVVPFRLALVLVVGIAMPTARADSISFEEEYALSTDRAALLEQLIPGSEDYYYFHALHAQQTGQLAAARALLPVWRKRHGTGPRYDRIDYRQTLLEYSSDPQATLDQLERFLSPKLDHRRRVADEVPDRPTAIEPSRLQVDRWIRETLAQHDGRLTGFTDAGLWLLTQVSLSPQQNRELLARITWPDYPGLVGRVVADLRARDSRGFGAFTIHSRLTLEQLESCLSLMPELLQNSNFVAAHIRQLAPTHPISFERDLEETIAYLDRLVAFSRRLGPVFNSFKAHVLYHRLDAGIREGKYRRDLFSEYLALPRPVHYVPEDFLKRRSSREHPANLNVDSSLRGGFPGIGQDWPLVREYLLHFFVDDESYDSFASLIRKEILADVFAEAKITAGVGDPEQWYGLLSSPSAVEALENRIDLDFAATNPRYFRADDPVRLALDIKNVPRLLVKIYPIHALNYYREIGEEIDTAISLDGLVPLHERTFEYEAPAWHRVRRQFDFPELSEPGTYVIEFLGAGRGSRAVVQKGRFHFTERVTSGGHVFEIFDDARLPVRDAVIWLGGHEFSADDSGHILIPFTKTPGSAQIVIGRSDSNPREATLERFDHRAESHALDVDFHLERETVIAGRMAELLVQAKLFVANERIPVERLKDVRLIIIATDHDGIPTRQEVADFELSNDEVSRHTFRTPSRLDSVEVQLVARIDNRSLGQEQTLTAQRTFMFNQLDSSDATEALFLSHTPDATILEVRGRSGEPIVDREVQVTLHRRGFGRTEGFDLKTDANGRITLGRLAGFYRVDARPSGRSTQSWQLDLDHVVFPARVQVVENETVVLPFIPTDTTSRESDFALFEVGRNPAVASTLRKIRSSAIRIDEGFVRIEGLDAGTAYDLLHRPTERTVRIEVFAGTERDGRAFGEHTIGELSPNRPLHVPSIAVDGDELVIQVDNWVESTRVQVTASRYHADRSLDDALSTHPLRPGRFDLGFWIAEYLTGRDLGDEFRYILDRKDAPRYPGVLLSRPGLLLNPFKTRSTETERITGQGGGQFSSRPGRGAAAPDATFGYSADSDDASQSGWVNLDFLPVPAQVLTNLVPDRAGKIRIPLDLLEATPLVHVVATGLHEKVSRRFVLPYSSYEPRDLTLRSSLVADQHYAEKKQITAVSPGESFTVEDLDSAQLEVYGDLASVYRYYLTLNADPTLAEFEFLLRWPTLDDAEKRRLYSKYACHELHFFLAEKDAGFFTEVVQPFLRHKKDPTLIDRYFAGEDLSEFLDPWRYGQLNVFERILLGGALPGEAVSTARHVQELSELDPIATEVTHVWFGTALAGRALEKDAYLPPKTETAADSRDKDAGRRYRRTMEVQDELQRMDRSITLGGEPAAEAAARREVLERAQTRSKKLGLDYDEDAAEAIPFYRAIERTSEYAENNYYHQPLDAQDADLVKASPFWVDYARHRSESPDELFVSTSFPSASRNFTEMVLALAVLDLPFSADDPEPDIEGSRLTFEASSPVIVFHREIQASETASDASILVGQNFFRHGDRYVQEGNVRRDKFVSGEFLRGVVYGSQVVVTNPTSAPLELDVLLQIPRGAVPVSGTHYTKSRFVSLGAYATVSLDTYFYFPRTGDFGAYPVHVSREGTTLAFADPTSLDVVDRLSEVDTTTWEYISQEGTPEQVLTFLEERNPHRLDLGLVAWRLVDPRSYQSFGRALFDTLKRRKVYSDTLWAYSLRHNDVSRLQEYLRQQESVYQRAGSGLESTLVTTDEVERKWYQHLEYRPLVNARVHPFGAQRKIQNQQFAAHYATFCDHLTRKARLDDEDRLAATYYLLLQDRISEALTMFASVDREAIPSKIQYDYMTAYLDLYSDRPEIAERIAADYRNHPVPHWQERFQAILDYLQPQVVERTDEGDSTTELAEREPTFDLRVEARQIALEYRNLDRIQVNYYPMDVELLFSSQPFVRSGGGNSDLEQWAMILPTFSETRDLPSGRSTIAFELPEQFRSTNVIVEVVAAGKRRSQAYYSNTLSVTIAQNYGRLQVVGERDGQPLPKTYVKVYARMADGSERFYKDGYTDLQGRFDYVALSTDDLDRVAEFALLVMNDERGATIQEVTPPQR